MIIEAREVMVSMLAGFVSDPPDSDFQRGYLEALIVFAREGLGIRNDDPVLQRAILISEAASRSDRVTDDRQLNPQN